MKIHQDLPGEEVQIQIVPLIDVIFCILTFFILASLQLTRQQAAISVDLPKASTGTTQQRDMIIVSLDSSGLTYVDQQPVTRDQLRQQLTGYRQINPNGLMVLYAPRTAVYDDIVQVLDILRAVGGDRVALATLPDASGATPPTTPGVPQVPAAPGTIPNSSVPSYPLPGSNTPYSLPGTTPPSSPGLLPSPGGFPGSQPVTPGGLNAVPTVPSAPGTTPNSPGSQSAF